MIENGIAEPYWLLTQQTTYNLLVLFWYTCIFDIPRYALAFVAAGLISFWHTLCGRESRQRPWREFAAGGKRQKITVIVPGHNEAASLERCIRSLHEQSLKDFEIVIVSDGSSDRTAEIASRMVQLGLADRFFFTDIRCGKSAAMNLADRYATGDIIVNVDCDCSYDRYALEYIVRPLLDDPAVGAVSGDIEVRNGKVSGITGLQALEYLTTISLGKRFEDAFGFVVCASGAFSAFRKTALDSVGGVDVGGGEDFDLTLRLRQRGWKIRFAADALCYTDAPQTLWALVRQRLRWERDAVRIRYRKHLESMNPFSRSFHATDAVHQLDFLFFHVVASLVLPIYVLWLTMQLGVFAVVILISVQLGLAVVDVVIALVAIGATGRYHMLRFFRFVFIYGFFVGFVMRFVRLWAYFEEWFFDASRNDNYVPDRVREARLW